MMMHDVESAKGMMSVDALRFTFNISRAPASAAQHAPSVCRLVAGMRQPSASANTGRILSGHVDIA
jgi:hypothetical protein